MPPDFVHQFLRTFPQSFVAALLLNGALFSLAYFVFWHKLKDRLRHWRIQVKARVNAQQIRRELKNALYTLAVGASMSSVVLYLAAHGHTRLYQDPARHSWWYNFGGFFYCFSSTTLGFTGFTGCCTSGFSFASFTPNTTKAWTLIRLRQCPFISWSRCCSRPGFSR